MEMISLREYVQSRPIENDNRIENLRGCSICNKMRHYKNMVYIMGNKIDGYGSASYIFCPKCLSQWKNAFSKSHPIIPDEWHFSTWNLDKPVPHTEVDRVFLYLKDGEFYLQGDYNPSKRITGKAIEEFP